MVKLPRKRKPRKSKPTYITPILMMALVLLMMGATGMIGIHFNEFTRMVREQVRVSLFLDDNLSEADIMTLRQRLEVEPFTRFTEYTSKEQAKQEFLASSGEEEDFEDLLGFNPLPASINLYLKASYTNPDSLNTVKAHLSQRYGLEPETMRVNEELVGAINRNLGMAGLVMMGIALLLIVVSLVLIDSTVRLSMYSNRFLIKSMQLVGAGRWFITKPYMLRSLFNGIVSGILACLGILGLYYLAQQQVPDLRQLQNMPLWIGLFALVMALGILISWWSTWRAVSKYLRTRLDELY